MRIILKRIELRGVVEHPISVDETLMQMAPPQKLYLQTVRALVLGALLAATLTAATRVSADSLSNNPIVFITTVPNPIDFGTFAATFGNHVADPETTIRGGDLWIRYPDGSLKNLTAAAGYGASGFQGATAIAVRDPSVHWDGTKVLFSMVVGAPTEQYEVSTYRWQLYEVTGLGSSETPSITKIANQPASYNNFAGTYASDDQIIFVSDRPRDNTVLHTYPQRDEYESAETNTGLWKLNPATGDLRILDHAPSGDFNPLIDSFGRVVFTRWDHLQRDQQNVGGNYSAFNYESEVSSTVTSSAKELYPEPRNSNDPDYISRVNLFTLNQFFPWAINQDGTNLETLNHIGRHEVGGYIERSFNDDPNVEEFYGQYPTGANTNEFEIMLHLKENPAVPGTYFGTNCPEFGTHAAGQIISITGAPDVNPNDMKVSYITHPDTASATDSPSAYHTGLHRDPLPLSNGNLVASHTSTTQEDTNIGTSSAPLSRYAFRIRLLSQSGSYFVPSTRLTSGISKSISYWSPDELRTYSGVLWELSPVEVRARPRPVASSLSIPAVEQGVIDSMGVDTQELINYLRSSNLALIVSRNLTVRDKNDRQQPINLRVAGTSTESLPLSGTIYDIARLDIFQGDLIRGYESGARLGRRVLAQPMHSVSAGVNIPLESLPTSSIKIASDGSMAAFVPAGRALTWQLSNTAGEPIVRERYWVTFQKGEVRVCASCHGVNTVDQLGHPAPTNPPLALAQLLAHWKNLPPPAEPTPTPTPGTHQYQLLARGLPSFAPRRPVVITARGGNSAASLQLAVRINGTSCYHRVGFPTTASPRRLRGRMPAGSAGREFVISLHRKRSSATLASKTFSSPGELALSYSNKVLCGRFVRSLR